jgi:GAF domain-containing protein
MHDPVLDGPVAADLDVPLGAASFTPAVASALRTVDRLRLDQPVGQYLQHVVDLVAEALPGIEAVSVALVDRRKVVSAAFSAPVAALLDERQYESGFGPSLAVAASGEGVVVDLTAETAAFPSFVRVAGRHGVRAAAALPLRDGGAVVGVLSLYCSTGQELVGHALATAREVADRLAPAVADVARYTAAVTLAEQLSEAMRSRAVIEQAKGVVMLEEGVDADAAWQHLSKASQRTNTKVHDVAAGIVARAQQASGPAGAARDDAATAG